MRDPSDITPLQAEILEMLWSNGGATTAEVQDYLSDSGDPARTTVATLLSRMESYGWLTRVRAGRAYQYRPALDRSSVRGAHVRAMIRSLFSEDLPSLVSHALREGEWDAEDLEVIEEMLRHHRSREVSPGSQAGAAREPGEGGTGEG